jgi:stage III sporulation protein AG
MDTIRDSIKKRIDILKSSRNDMLRKCMCFLVVGICMLIILWPYDKSTTDNDTSDLTDSEDSYTGDNASIKEDSTYYQDDSMSYYSTNEYITNMEQKLETILSNVKNVGNVDVMITLKDNGEKVVEKDYEKSQSVNGENSQTSSKEETVTTKEDNNTTPYVTKTLEPEIEGIVICCDGGGNSETVVNITEAVTALYDVPVHKIKVLERNRN